MNCMQVDLEQYQIPLHYTKTDHKCAGGVCIFSWCLVWCDLWFLLFFCSFLAKQQKQQTTTKYKYMRRKKHPRKTQSSKGINYMYTTQWSHYTYRYVNAVTPLNTLAGIAVISLLCKWLRWRKNNNQNQLSWLRLTQTEQYRSLQCYRNRLSGFFPFLGILVWV